MQCDVETQILRSREAKTKERRERKKGKERRERKELKECKERKEGVHHQILPPMIPFLYLSPYQGSGIE